MDSSLHRLCVEQVLDHPAVPEEQKLALRCFLKSWHGHDVQGAWMRAQKGWKQAAALLASANLESAACQLPGSKRRVSSHNGVNPFRILLCGFGRKLCERGDQCRRCALDRIDLAWSEFLPAWERANYWYALVLAMDRRAEHAGIHQGDGTLNPNTSATPVFQPFKGRADGAYPLHSGSELEYILDDTRRAFFDTVKAIRQEGIVGGAFAHFEIAFSFWRGDSNFDVWSRIRHRVEPQLNVLVNAPQLLDIRLIRRIYDALVNCLSRRLPPGCRWSYPDLWFAPILTPKGMAGWLGYMLKSWRFDAWYQDALNRRCDRRELNLCFDEIVFENGHRLARPKAATRRYGNLHFNPRAPGACIAQQIPERPTQEQIQRLKDEKYAAEHPDLEDAMFFWAQKRLKRRGHSRDSNIED